MSETLLDPTDNTDDRFLGGRVRAFQPKLGFRAAIDSVLLPAAIESGNGLEILDAGLGCGIASLCLLARLPEVRITGIENQQELAELAAINAERNGFAFDVLATDFIAWRGKKQFDQVMTNPPYFEAGRGTQSPVRTKARANAGPATKAWIEQCIAHLKPGGMLTLIHRADCEKEILAALDGRAGHAEIIPFLPRAGKAPRRILLRARKGAASGVKWLPGFILHGKETKYTEAAEAVLRHGQPISWVDYKADTEAEAR